MPLDNHLNTSELLRRLGLKGDSLGSMPLLESLRLSLNIGDLSDLVPPVRVPIGAANIPSTSGVATVNRWALRCMSPGGLTVTRLSTLSARTYNLFVSLGNPFGSPAIEAAHNFSFEQPARSAFFSATPFAKVAPAFAYTRSIGNQALSALDFDNWVGPGEFFAIEGNTFSVSENMAIMWKEYPAALNPG